MTLSKLAILLGFAFGLPQIYGLVQPAAFRDAMRKFPRSLPWGYALVAVATGWFLYYLRQEQIADFTAFKPYMMAAFVALGIGTCIYVNDFLAVRGLAVVLLLLAKLMVDTARWAETEWRLVIVIWAYAWVIAGIWFTISPWRLRDLIDWSTATEQRIRVGSGIRLAFGLFVAALGFTVF
jgi:hypothetical protein